MTGCPWATTIVPKERSSSNIPGLDIPKIRPSRGRAKYAPDQRTLAVPRVPIYQPNLDVAMQKNIRGYQYWFHRQLDYRQLTKE